MNKVTFTLALCALLLAGLLFTPYGVQGVMEVRAVHQSAAETKAIADNNLAVAKNNAVSSVQDFINNRTFGVAYDDVSKLSSVLGSVSGIQVANVYSVDPSQGYVDIGFHVEGSTAKAVRFELIVENPEIALSAIETLQLATVSIEYNAPDAMDVIFLTGGDI